jgi:hypothetical protein
MDRKKKLISKIRNLEYFFLYDSFIDLDFYLWVEADGSTYINYRHYPDINEIKNNTN